MEARATREGGVRTALASQNVTDNEMGGKRRERGERGEIAEEDAPRCRVAKRVIAKHGQSVTGGNK